MCGHAAPGVLVDRPDVAARAEAALARPGDQDRGDGVVELGVGECFGDARHHGVIQRVEGMWTVEGDVPDASFGVQQNGIFVVHECAPVSPCAVSTADRGRSSAAILRGGAGAGAAGVPSPPGPAFRPDFAGFPLWQPAESGSTIKSLSTGRAARLPARRPPEQE